MFLNVNNATRQGTQNNMFIKMQNILWNILQSVGRLFVKNASKESAEKESSTNSLWESEVRVIRINRKTGEKYIE